MVRSAQTMTQRVTLRERQRLRYCQRTCSHSKRPSPTRACKSKHIHRPNGSASTNQNGTNSKNVLSLWKPVSHDGHHTGPASSLPNRRQMSLLNCVINQATAVPGRNRRQSEDKGDTNDTCQFVRLRSTSPAHNRSNTQHTWTATKNQSS